MPPEVATAVSAPPADKPPAALAPAEPTPSSTPAGVAPPKDAPRPTAPVVARTSQEPPPPSPRPPKEKDQYHVYRMSPGTNCEVDMRNHKRFSDDRGSGHTCMGHFDYRMDADKLRDKLIKENACKK